MILKMRSIMSYVRSTLWLERTAAHGSAQDEQRTLLLLVFSSEIRTCPHPQVPVFEAHTEKPILCQIRGSPLLECPPNSRCENATGFCCQDDAVLAGNSNSVRQKPEATLGKSLYRMKNAPCSSCIGYFNINF